MLRVIGFDNGARLVVETEDHDSDIPAADVGEAPPTLPDGVEPVSAFTNMRKAAPSLATLVAGVAALAQAAATSAQPSAITIEASVKFTSDVQPIPFLASTSGEGGLKLTLKWDKDTKPQPVAVEDSKNAKSA